MVPTCIGCGAMSLPGECATGCSERKLELIRGAVRDALIDVAERAEVRAGGLRAVLDDLAETRPANDAWDLALEDLRNEARSTLHRYPDVEHPGRALVRARRGGGDVVVPEVWGCGRASRVPGDLHLAVVQWVNVDAYDAARCGRGWLASSERRLRDVVRRLAYRLPARRSSSAHLARAANTRRSGAWRIVIGTGGLKAPPEQRELLAIELRLDTAKQRALFEANVRDQSLAEVPQRGAVDGGVVFELGEPPTEIDVLVADAQRGRRPQRRHARPEPAAAPSPPDESARCTRCARNRRRRS